MKKVCVITGGTGGIGFASGMEGLDRTMSWCALGRPGRPEEIAYLFSTIIDERNSYLTGTDIYLDGGCDAAGYHGQREWYPGTKD